MPKLILFKILLQIVDGNAKTDVSNRKEPGMFCGESEQPQIFMSETSFVKVLFHVENFTDQTYFSFDTRAEQQLVVYLRYGQHPELYPNRRGEIVQGWVIVCFIMPLNLKEMCLAIPFKANGTTHTTLRVCFENDTNIFFAFVNSIIEMKYKNGLSYLMKFHLKHFLKAFQFIRCNRRRV